MSKGIFINVYDVTQCYGGPEEGGWYYHWRDCVGSVHVRGNKIESTRQLLEREYPREHDYEVCLERKKAQSQSMYRPIYE